MREVTKEAKEKAEELIAALRQRTNIFVEKHKENSAIKLINKTISSLEGVLGNIDKFLKSKGVDVGRAYETGVARAKDAGQRIGQGAKNLAENIQETSPYKKVEEYIDKTQAVLREKFKSDTESSTSPPALLDKFKSLLGFVADKKEEEQEENRSALRNVIGYTLSTVAGTAKGVGSTSDFIAGHLSDALGKGAKGISNVLFKKGDKDKKNKSLLRRLLGLTWDGAKLGVKGIGATSEFFAGNTEKAFRAGGRGLWRGITGKTKTEQEKAKKPSMLKRASSYLDSKLFGGEKDTDSVKEELSTETIEETTPSIVKSEIDIEKEKAQAKGKEAFDTLTDKVKGKLKLLQVKGSSIVSDINSKVTNSLEVIKNTSTGVVNSLSSKVTSSLDRAKNIGKGLLAKKELTPEEQEQSDWKKGLLNRSKKRREEVEAEKKAVRDQAQASEPKKDSWFDRAKNIGKGLLAKKELTPEEQEKKEKAEWKKGLFNRSKERTKKRRDEVEAEKKAVREKAALNKKDSWLSKILNGVKLLGGLIVAKIGAAIKAIGFGINFLGGFLFKGLGNFIKGIPGFLWTKLKLLPGLLSTKIAAAFPGLTAILKAIGVKLGVTAAVTTAGTVAGTAAAAKAGATVAGTAAAAKAGTVAAGTAVAGTAAAGAGKITAGKVALGVASVAGIKFIAAGALVAGAVYGAYRLYRHLTEIKVGNTLEGLLNRLRLAYYGFVDRDGGDHIKVVKLEMLLAPHLKYVDNVATLDAIPAATYTEMLDIFNIRENSTIFRGIFGEWINRRFIPAYTAFMTVLRFVNKNTSIDDLSKITPQEAKQIVRRIQVPMSIYDIVKLPYFRGENTANNETRAIEILGLLNDKLKQLVPEPLPAVANNTPTRTPVTAQASAAAPIARENTNPLRNNTAVPSPPIRPLGPVTAPDQEGEPEPSNSNIPQASGRSTAGSLNIAAGNLYPGGMGLEGIVTRLDKSLIYNLDPNMRELFTGMAREYHALTGKNIPVNEAFRTYERQADLFRRMPDRAARPGHSVHEFGLGIDINSATSQELDKMGLLRKYGFTASIGGEKWHLEPIGVSLNPRLAITNPEHRQNAILSSPGRGGGGYGLTNNSRLKRRNIALQQSIFEKGKNSIVNPADAASGVSRALPTARTAMNTAGAVPGAASGATAARPTTPNVNTGVRANAPTPITSTRTDSRGAALSPSEDPVKPREINPNNTAINNTSPVRENNRASRPTVDATQFAHLPTVEAITKAANITGLEPDKMITFAKLESSLNPNAQARTSSASGLFQIVRPTWSDLMKKHSDKYNIPDNADIKNPFYNSLLAAEFSLNNKRRLVGYKQAGVPDHIAIYLAHHFGLAGANRIFRAANTNPNMLMREAVSESAYRANPHTLRNVTVAQYLRNVEARFNRSSTTAYRPVQRDGTVGAPRPPTAASSTPANTSASTPPRAAPAAPVNQPHIPAPRPPIAAAAAAPIAQAQPQQPAQPSHREMFNTKTLETIMNDQLSTLTQIASILTNINEKFDNKNQTPPPTQPPKPVDRNIPRTSINLKRNNTANYPV